MNTSEYEDILMTGLLQKPFRLSALDGKIDVGYFFEAHNRTLFDIASKIAKKTLGKILLDFSLAKRMCSDKFITAVPAIEEYECLPPVSDAEFDFAVNSVCDRRRQKDLQDAGLKALNELTDGNIDAARSIMERGILNSEKDDDESTPVDLLSKEALEEEKGRSRESIPSRSTFDLGFPSLTQAGSFSRGALSIIAGYTGDGKSQLSKTIAMNVCMKRKNVFFTALEMSKQEVLALVIAQYVAMTKPGNGIDWSKAISGGLASEEKRLYLEALDELAITNDSEGTEINSKMGKFFAWSPKQQITVENFCMRVRAINSEHGLDLAVADYLELMSPSKDLGQYRLNVKSMCERLKNLAREEDILCIANHQISRQGRDKAEERDPKHYILRDLGESSGVERSADSVIWIYTDEDLKGDLEARVGLAKMRQGRTITKGFEIMADYERSILAEVR